MKSKLLVPITILFLSFSFLLFFSPNFSRSYHHFFTKSTNLSNENINKIKLNNSIISEKIISIYGPITEKSTNNSLFDYYKLDSNLEIATNINENKIIRIISCAEGLKTKKGITIGDKKETIISSYGKNYYSRIEQGLPIIGYIDKEKDWSIEFWMIEDKVEMIRFDYTFMN